MERIILHSDLNNFFASVEAITTPSLSGKDKFIAVCGMEEDRHGIVLAKNENAKRMGVRTGDTIWQAKQKCPDIIITNPHFDKYEYYSEIVREIYSQYTDEVEPFGMDECWLDVSRSTSLFGSGKTIAEIIRKRIKDETGLTVSVGVSFNKIFAKLCSDLKKPDAVTVVENDNFRERLWSLPACEMLGVGKSTYQILKKHGIFTIGDIARTPIAYLENWLGKNGASLHSWANGADDSRVLPYDYSPIPKSISHGVTCRHDLKNTDEACRVLLYLSSDISTKLREKCLFASSVTIGIRDNKLRTYEYSTNISTPTRSHAEIYKISSALFSKSYEFDTPVRALTIRTTKLINDSEPVSFDFFTDINRSQKLERKEAAVDAIRQRFGKDIIIPAALMSDIKLPHIINKAVLPGTIRAK